ncbi:outer membrane protein transport protein [Pseudoflavitalea rhizosphaerae]|uniref:outer membrane protein transport protein n=1 Tax=Pseudoflavitalea rhizosphaerae TaxID=1884793 RepID=UPI000F8F5056|nr:hypothetical protein [Pseudoflavitalea rhizosphaerae]
MQYRIIVLTIFSLIVVASQAQSINSPYSTYGIGDIEHRYYDKTAGIANAGTALMSNPFHLLNKNPASIAGLERSVLLGNATFVGKTVSYAGNSITSDNNTGRDIFIKNFSVAIKLNKFWTSGVSLMPYSYVNYSYRSKLNIEGSTETYDALYEGDGGVYSVSWNNAINAGKHLALGVRTSLLTGSVNQTESLQTAYAEDPIETKRKDYYNKFRFEYGAIYSGKLGKSWQYALGGKFSAKTDLDREKSVKIEQGNTVIRNEEVIAKDHFTLPMTFDLGLALTSKGRTTYTVDYTYQDWAANRVRGSNWSTINSYRIAAGVQMSNIVEQWNMKFEKSYMQVGGYFNRSYLRVNNTPIDEVGATIGYGGYLSGKMSYGLALEAGRRGTVANNLIKETFVQLSFRFSFREFLYSKGRKYD